jgi:hypothetical protein
MEAKDILKVVPGLQATSLVMYNVKNIPSFKMTKKKQKPMKFMKTGITTIAGIGLINPTAKMINEL